MVSTTITAAWTSVSGSATTQQFTISGTTTDPESPVVILLHGTNGTIEDMRRPAVHPGWTCDRSTPLRTVARGAHHYPGVGIWGYSSDGPMSREPEGWQPVLERHGFLTLNYQQVEPAGRLFDQVPLDPVRQLDAIVKGVIAALPGRRIAFVTHSRGGILFRTWFAKLGGASSDVVQRLGPVLMLASPNQGSRLANVAVALHDLVNEPLLGLGWLREAVDSETSSPAYRDYEVGSPLLADLAASELVRQADVHTVGGTGPNVTRLHQWTFTLDSVWPRVQITRGLPDLVFDWRTADEPFAWVVRNVTGDLHAGLPELTDGQGDVLVADANARLPGRPHDSFHLNHAESLFDPFLLEWGAQLLSAGRGVALTDTDAASVSATFPPLLDPGTMTVTARVSNTGTHDWVGDHSLQIDAGPGLPPPLGLPATTPVQAGHGELRQVPLPVTVGQQGGTVTVRLQVIGPAGPLGQPFVATVSTRSRQQVCLEVSTALDEAVRLRTELVANPLPGSTVKVAALDRTITSLRARRTALGCP